MKKIFTLIALAIGFNSQAQNSIQVKDMSTAATVAANSTVNLVTTANSTTSRIFDIKNTSTSTQTYVLIRYDKTLNSGAAAYFCFAGNCFPPLTTISGSLILAAGQSASQSTVAYTMLTADIDEGAATGFSHVKYTFKNASVTNDTLQINLLYNNPAAGIFESGINKTSLQVYPNPAKEFTTLYFKSTGSVKMNIELIDVSGKLVYSNNSFDAKEGENKITIQTSEFAAGNYNLVLRSDKGITTEKIVITK